MIGSVVKYMIDVVIILITVILFSLSISAQSSQFITYPSILSSEFDFGNGEVVDIQEDWQGFIWIATTDGLYRFDGTEARLYDHRGVAPQLVHPFIYTMLVDHEHREIWIGTRGGVTRFDPLTEQAEHYTVDYDDSTSIADNLIRSIVKNEKGEIWFSCLTRGLSRYNRIQNNFSSFYFEHPNIDLAKDRNPGVNQTAFNNYNKIFQDPDRKNILWLSSGAGMLTFDTENLEYNDVALDLPSNTPNLTYLEQPIQHAIAANQSVYFAQGRNIAHYNPKEQTVDVLKYANDLDTELGIIKRLWVLDNQSLYVSLAKGLLRIDLKNKENNEQWIDNPDNSEFYGLIVKDGADRSWVYSSGVLALYQFQDYYPRTYQLKDRFKSSVELGKSTEDGRMLLFTADHDYYHIFNLEKEGWAHTQFKPANHFSSEGRWMDLIIDEGDQYYLLSEKALFRFDIETGVIEKVDLDFYNEEQTFVKCIKDQSGNLWLSTYFSGLYRIDKNGSYVNYRNEFNTDFHESLFNWITDLHEDQNGRIWIRLSRSYAIYDPRTDSIQNFPIEQHEDQTFRYISNFTEDNIGNIWCGSLDQGLGRIDLDTLESGIVEVFNIEDGLLDNYSWKVAVDAEGDIWSLNKGGVSMLRARDRIFQNLPWSIGLPRSTQFEFLTKNHIGLILDDGGICVIPKEIFTIQNEEPIPFLSALRVHNKVSSQGTKLDLQNLTVIGPRNNISFGISALGFHNPKEFAYRLVGVDEDWVETEQRQTPLYSNLSPGNYQFLIKARNENSDWSAIKEIDLILVPRWWETFWFKLLIGILVATVLYYLYKSRLETVRTKSALQQKIKELEMQTLRAQMNPHFLYNSLNSIQNFIIKNHTKEAVGYLDRFSRLVRLILQNSRSRKVPIKDEVEALKHYLELESLRFKRRFSYTIEVDPSINQNDVEMPPMLIQPFVENAILHGLLKKESGGKLVVKIDKYGDKLICVIRDNGIGRAAAGANKKGGLNGRKSMGTSITKNRLDMLNEERGEKASMNIRDLVDAEGNACGTEVEIVVYS